MTSPAHLALLLSIATAVTATLASCLLALGERQPWLAIVSLLSAAASVWLVDIKQKVRLSARMTNIGGLLAVAVAIGDITRFSQDSRLLALANLMVYLQLVLLWHPKNTRIFAMLALLALLQVAVGAALNLTLSSGGLLLAYIVSATTTVTLWQIYRAVSAQAALGQPALQPASGQPASGSPFSSSVVSKSAPRPISLPAGALQPIVATPRAATADAAAFGWPFWWQMARGISGALIVCVLSFLLVPRIAKTSDDDLASGEGLLTGPANTVELGNEKLIVESAEEAMEVRFFDYETGLPYKVNDEPYFRGVILTEYRDKRWLPPAFDRGEDSLEMEVVDPVPFLPNLVRQDIRIGPQGFGTLYSVYPVINANDDVMLLCDFERQEILRPSWLRRQSFFYSLVTSGFYNGRQYPITPALNRFDHQQDLLSLPDGTALATLQQMAEATVAGIDENDHMAQARALESFLRYSGQFNYTLDISSKDTGIDPVEDFVRNSRQGHCEYFASALTLMLRQLGIPARMVVGYKGGEWNMFGRFYRVRHLHAHAWVEAYLDQSKLPATLPQPMNQWDGGGWLRLDPTPASERQVALADAGALSALIYQALDFTRFLWTSYVLGMDAQRQWDAIYQPLLTTAKSLVNRDAWSEGFDYVRHAFWGGTAGWLQGDWFNWSAGLIGMAVCLVGVGIYRGGRRLWQMFLTRTSLGQVVAARRLGFDVAFYRRLEAALAKRGTTRTPGQTQREFAQAAAVQLRCLPETHGVSDIPLRVVDAFYDVRFGGRTLDRSQSEAVEQAISRLELALANSDDSTER